MALALILSLAGPAPAGSLEEGNDAFAGKDYDRAMELLLPHAEDGEIKAQVKVGFMYLYGEGTGRDFHQAYRWISLAAERNDPIAQVLLSRMYENGLGVKRDYDKAVRWCKRAAEQGNADAQAQMGHFLSEGLGCVESKSAAVDWLYRAGMTYLESGNREMALAMVDQIKRISPDHFLRYRLMDAVYEEK